MSIDRGSLYSFSVAAVAAAGTSPFSNDVSLTGQSCSSGAGRCLQTGLTILPVPVAGERSTRRALLELGREQRDRVPSWLCFAITIVLSSPASERLVSVDFVAPNNTRTLSHNIRRSNFGARPVKRSVSLVSSRFGKVPGRVSHVWAMGTLSTRSIAGCQPRERQLISFGSIWVIVGEALGRRVLSPWLGILPGLDYALNSLRSFPECYSSCNRFLC